MQILYWHLRRPTRSSFGGQLHSPPLLERPTSASVNIDAFTNLLEELELEEEMEMQDGDIMEVDENGDTVFYLNVENFIEDPDGGEGHHQTELQADFESLVVPYQVQEEEEEQGVVEYSQHNGGFPEELCEYQEDENGTLIEYTTTTIQNQQFSNGHTGNKRKGNGDPLADDYADGFGSDEEEDSETEFQEPVVTKRPKLVVNLYEEERGYEIGCILPDQNGKSEISQISHCIQYSEDSILKAIDREEIPDKLLADREECYWNRGHVVAQIRDFRRFSASAVNNINNHNHKSIQLSRQLQIQKTNQIAATTTSTINNRAPVIREVVLRPTTQSILSDFDRLIDQSIKDREKWKTSSQNYNNNPVSEDSDSEFEFEADIPSSLSQESDELTFEQRLELEKEFVNRSSGSLCLDPSPVVGLINNRIQYEKLKWTGLKPKKQTKAVVSEYEAENTPNAALSAFSSFIHGVKDRVGCIKDPEPLKLPMIPCLNYPSLETPTNMEDIIKIGPRPEPCSLRTLHIDNYVKKIEEYTLETERRKRPHTTKLSIFQRNGMDCYFGELEMESILDAPSIVKPGGTVKDTYATTKCQFELGSSRSVALYVKQFSDIFTEDGRRPCKITYQKVGQPLPQILYTNSYKLPTTPSGQTPAPGSSSPASSSGTANGMVPTAANTNQASPSSSSAVPPQTVQNVQPTQPPVQIVHPQPRSVQQAASQGGGDNQLFTTTVNQQQQQNQHNQPVASVSPSVNFNLNVNSVATAVATPQQILTRPQIVSLNLQPQQQQQQQQNASGVQGLRTTTAQQQLLQQRLLRLKQIQQAQQQQQAQVQQQQPTTALAKLLLTNIQQNSTGSRPITVAVQPQPQTSNKLEPQQQQQQHQLTVNPSTLMISNQGVGGTQQNSTQNLNVNVNTSPNLSVNLNSMMLDSLLSGGALNVGGNTGGNVGTNLISSGNLRVAGGGGGNTAQGNTVNILRVNNTANGTGLSTGAQTLQRQLSMNAMTTGNLILQQSQPQQRILINANSGQQIGSVTVSSGGNSGDVEELSVPDLNSLLNAAGQNGQTQTLQMAASNSGLTQMNSAQQTSSVDTHNLNLNLNVNLNSGTVMSTGDSSHSQLQTTGQGPPPFLVFISPLRSVPVSISTSSGLSRQVTAMPTVVSSASSSTLSLNLGTVQSLHQQVNSSNNMDSIVTSLASTNSLMTASALSNNNVIVSSQNVSSSGEAIDDSIFNALSEAIGPEFGQKLDGLGGGNTTNTVMIGNTPYTVSVSSSGNNQNSQQQISPAIISNSNGGEGNNSHNNNNKKQQQQDTSIITLSDLLGSSASSSSSTTITNPSGLSSLILNPAGGSSGNLISNQGLSSSQNSVSSTSNSSSGSVLSSTPRLSALLAGTPSADSSMSSTRNSVGSSPLSLSSPTSLSDSSSVSGATLLDRLTASLSNNNNNSNYSNQPHHQQRTSGSGLNPIASATPNVVLEHPVLAATLTGQQSSRGVSAYQKIAPAPTASLLNRKHN